MLNNAKVVGIGELLWDVLPTGKVLGGAPGNFAFHAKQMGCEALVISAIGMDDDGDEILEELNKLAIPSKLIQRNQTYPTGWVSIELDEKGIPDYTIHEQVAWDYIEWNQSLQELAAEADSVCFGSLAQRTNISRRSIWNFLAATKISCLRVFDINLRQHYYNDELILKSLEYANVLKLNEEELPLLAKLLGYQGDAEAVLHKLLDEYQIKLIAYTRGENGSQLITSDEESFCPVPKVEIADTVGAGDSFTAVLIAGLLQQVKLRSIHQKATEIAAFVCTQKGATPNIPSHILEFNFNN